MGHKYGIYQSSPSSCIFYKQDEDGNQSTFNLFLIPEDTSEADKKIFSFIDNEQIRTKSWFGAKNLSIQDVMKAFGEWASGAPIVFEMDAIKSISTCLGFKLRK